MISAQPEAKQDQALASLRVLLIEDEYFIADDVARALRDAGAAVIGPCPTVAQAERAVEAGGLDFAILDLNLNGESGAKIAGQLSARNIPFMFATGYGSPPVPDRFKGFPRCEKPFDPIEVVQLVARSVQERATDARVR